MIAFFFYRIKRRVQSLATASRLLVFSFACAILIGAFFLATPLVVPEDGKANSFLDALFTSASAVCITGLVVRDTGGDYNAAGQAVILFLIQIGGLGILTFSNFMVLTRQGRIGFKERQILQQTHGILPAVSPAQLLRQIVFYTFLFEGVGAALLAWRFSLEPDRTLSEALWLGVFHAVSAFCNAGFCLFSDNLIRYRDDPPINIIITSLVIIGGLGWVVFADLGVRVRNLIRGVRGRLSLHTRVVLSTTAILVLGGAAVIYVLELVGNAMPPSFGKHFEAAFFLSTTARTAGFNTVDTGQLTNATILVVLVLMAIGGSPGGTAGGIKTTTFASLVAYFFSRIRNRPQPELFRRTIPADVVTKSMLTVVCFVVITSISVILLQITELSGESLVGHREKFLDHLFEVTSALGTVGLSTGITPDLSASGRIIIIICMFLGRLGPLLVAHSFIGTRRRIEYRYPQGRIIVG